MKDTRLDIEQVLRRRLNWGKCAEAKIQDASESSIVDEIDNRFTSLKKKITYRDKVIAESREIISNHQAIIASKERAITTKDALIKELEEEVARLKAIAKESMPTPKLTSKNSSVPPSKSPLGTPQTRSLREKSGKKCGGQAGHARITGCGGFRPIWRVILPLTRATEARLWRIISPMDFQILRW